MKPRSKMSRPLGPPAPAWPLGNPNLIPQRMNYQQRGVAMAAGMDIQVRESATLAEMLADSDKIEVIDLTVERETTAEERASQIMLQGFVFLGTKLGMVEPRS